MAANFSKGLKRCHLSDCFQLSKNRRATVIREDRVRDDRRRGEPAVLIDHDLNAICRQYFDGAGKSRLRERVGIHPEIEGAGYVSSGPIVADCLGNREDVVLVKAALEGGPRWPDVPNETRCCAMAGSGFSVA
jgi:hypothetical protein